MKNRFATALMMTLLLCLTPVAASEDDWHFGIGTGIFGLNLEGDAGVGTVAGAVDFDVSVSGDEIREVMETAFGLGGFASKGKWTIDYSIQTIELEDDLDGSVGPVPASAVITFKGSGAEATASYRFAVKGKHVWSVLSGLRYSKHEYDLNITVGAAAPFMRNIDNDWTDLVVGLKHGTKLSDKWNWSNRLDGAFGGSEGTFHFNTSFNRHFAKRWVVGLFAKITAVDFEEDSRSDLSWYLYDVNEFGVGANVVFTW